MCVCTHICACRQTCTHMLTQAHTHPWCLVCFFLNPVIFNFSSFSSWPVRGQNKAENIFCFTLRKRRRVVIYFQKKLYKKVKKIKRLKVDILDHGQFGETSTSSHWYLAPCSCENTVFSLLGVRSSRHIFKPLSGCTWSLQSCWGRSCSLSTGPKGEKPFLKLTHEASALPPAQPAQPGPACSPEGVQTSAHLLFALLPMCI